MTWLYKNFKHRPSSVRVTQWSNAPACGVIDCGFESCWIHIFSFWFFYTPDLSGRIMVYRGCLSVCPSVRPSVHKACKHDTDWTVPAKTFKLGTLTTYDKRTKPIDFQGHGSKVKVTCNTLLLNLVNTIQTEPFKLGPSNLVHILLMTRRRHLLISKVRGQRSRSHTILCC